MLPESDRRQGFRQTDGCHHGCDRKFNGWYATGLEKKPKRTTEVRASEICFKNWISNVLTEDYDDEYEAIRQKLMRVYDRIEDSGEKDPKPKADGALKKGVRSSDNIQKILDDFDLLFERMNCKNAGAKGSSLKELMSFCRRKGRQDFEKDCVSFFRLL